MSTNYADPFDVWKTFYQEIEPQISKSLHGVLGSEAYATISAQLLSTFLQMEQYFTKNIENLLQTYKMPSLKDFERLSELVVGLESKIDLIDERLLRLEQQGLQSGDVKEQIASLSDQLTAIGESIQTLAKTNQQETENTRQKRTQKSN